MAIADIGAGATQAVQQIQENRRKDADLKSLLTQRMFEQQLQQREQDQRERYQQEQLRQFAEQRAATADLRQQTAADRLESGLSPGDTLDPTQTTMLRAAARGSDIDHQTATLPSTQYGGGSTAPGSSGGSMPAIRPGQGFLTTTTNAGNPDQDVFRGTHQQRAIQGFLRTLTPGSRERQVAEYEAATGRNAPAIFMPQPQREPVPHYGFMQTYNPDGTPGDVLRTNSVDGSAGPVNFGGSIRPPRPERANDLPQRVQNYLLDLRGRHRDFDSAFGELRGVLANAPDETFNRVATVNALRQMYAEPGGLLGMLGLGGGGAGAPGGSETPNASPAPRAPAMTAPGAASGQTLTRDELRAVAQRLGVSEQQAEQQARARGLQVR